MYYISKDEQNKILVSHISNSDRPQSEIKISKTNFDKIKWVQGKIYKYIENDVVEEDDPDYINILKSNLIEKEKNKTNQAILNGFTFENKIYQLDLHDQINYSAMLSKKNNLPEQVEITLKNGDFVMLPSSKIDALTDAAFSHKMNALQQYKNKVKLIKQCATIAELELLDE